MLRWTARARSATDMFSLTSTSSMIDEVKSRVAIWKHERYADGDVQWLHPDTTQVAGESSRPEEDK